MVVRGAVRVVAAVAMQATIFAAADRRPADHTQWQGLWADLKGRHERRRASRRFRRDPAAYLAPLEAQLLQMRLPAGVGM